MKRIAISQRRDVFPERTENRDGLDTRFAERLWQWGFLPLPLASSIPDAAAYIQALKPDALVLTGGNDIGTVPERDTLEIEALNHAALYHIPVLGICRGLQMINHYQGGQLHKITAHVATTHVISGPLTQNLPRYVNSYHNQGIYAESLGSELEALAWAEDNSIEALRHTRLPWLGIMWHPERDTPTQSIDQQHIISLLQEGRLP